MVCILHLVLLASCVYAQTTDVDAIVNFHFEKVGGKDAWKELKTYYIEQAFFTNHESTSFTGSLQESTLELQKTYYRHPGQYRTEIYIKGELTGTLLADTSEAKINMEGYEQILPNEDDEFLLNNTQLYAIGPTPLLLEAAEKGAIAYEGLVEAYGKDCHKLVFAAEGFTGKLIVYLDTETYLIHAYGNTDEQQRYHKIYTNYQKVQDIVIPYKFLSYDKGQLYEEYTILKAQVNEEMDDYVFNVW